MVTCTYCGASVEPGIETCPDCGASLPPNPKIEIRQEPRPEYRAVSPEIFIIQSMPDANYYYLKKNAAAVFVRCLLFVIILFMLEGHNSNPTNIMIILFVLAAFVMAYYNVNRKKVKLVVNGSDIEYSLNNDKRSIVGTDIVNVEGKQSPMQEINKAGDIKITINPGGVNEVIELNDIADYDMSFIKLKNYVSSYKS